jgi:hypothetical protein
MAEGRPTSRPRRCHGDSGTMPFSDSVNISNDKTRKAMRHIRVLFLCICFGVYLGAHLRVLEACFSGVPRTGRLMPRSFGLTKTMSSLWLSFGLSEAPEDLSPPGPLSRESSMWAKPRDTFMPYTALREACALAVFRV